MFLEKEIKLLYKKTVKFTGPIKRLKLQIFLAPFTLQLSPLLKFSGKVLINLDKAILKDSSI